MGFRAHVARFTSKKRELMRAVWRLGMMAFAAGLLLASPPAVAQDAATATSNTPATDSVGPRDLQNFTLNGTVTRSADPVAVTRSTTSRPAAQPPRDNSPPAASASPAPRPTNPADNRPAVREAVRSADADPASAPPPRIERSVAPPSSSVTVALPPVDDSPVSTAAAGTLSPPGAGLGDERRLLLWPWLLAALALGAGGAFLFWRNHRNREALAGGPQLDAFVAPEPLPRPTPAPAPPKPAPPAPPIGLVSTRLRPWIDFAFQPGRCIVEDGGVTFEFELAVQNSGNAPARAVLVEASLMNAGPYQDQEISAFYGSPVGEGERIAIIPPLKTFLVQTKVVAPLASVQLIEIGGRRVFVPIIAFNALYGWSTGEGQTSTSYLLGRDTKGEKLGPFRLDLGPRVFRNVGARALPIAVRK